MKKYVCVLALFLMCASAHAGPSQVKWLDSQVIRQGGSSVFAVDMRGTDYENFAGYSVQLSGITAYYAAYSGATYTVSHAVVTYLPTGLTESELGTVQDGASITGTVRWVPIFYQEAHDGTGIDWPRCFTPDAGRYLLLKVDNTSGATDLQGSAYFIGNKRDCVDPIPIGHETEAFGTTGTTNFTTAFTIPDGCKCVEIQFTSTDGGYSSPSTSGVSKIAEENSIIQMPDKEFRKGSFGPGAAVAGEVNAQYWTSCPAK